VGAKSGATISEKAALKPAESNAAPRPTTPNTTDSGPGGIETRTALKPASESGTERAWREGRPGVGERGVRESTGQGPECLARADSKKTGARGNFFVYNAGCAGQTLNAAEGYRTGLNATIQA